MFKWNQIYTYCIAEYNQISIDSLQVHVQGFTPLNSSSFKRAPKPCPTTPPPAYPTLPEFPLSHGTLYTVTGVGKRVVQHSGCKESNQVDLVRFKKSGDIPKDLGKVSNELHGQSGWCVGWLVKYRCLVVCTTYTIHSSVKTSTASASAVTLDPIHLDIPKPAVGAEWAVNVIHPLWYSRGRWGPDNEGEARGTTEKGKRR